MKKNHKTPIITDEIMNELYDKCNLKLETLKEKFPDYPFNDFLYNDNYYKRLIQRAKSNSSSNNYLTSIVIKVIDSCKTSIGL